MAVLNKNAATLLHKHKAHGATDVTGFGLLGHAKNLAAAQRADIDIIIEKVPVFAGMSSTYEGLHDFKVLEGYSAETSGGILAILSEEDAEQYVKEAHEVYGHTVWKIGKVVAGSK